MEPAGRRGGTPHPDRVRRCVSRDTRLNAIEHIGLTLVAIEHTIGFVVAWSIVLIAVAVAIKNNLK